jgi:hypothetical protein
MITQGNIIIVSHCRDEIIYFYDYIDKNSILIFVSMPSNQRDREVLNGFIAEAGARYIQLDEIETFDTTFQLSERNKTIIKNFLEYKPSRIITQGRATIESDIISRRVYDFINDLQTDLQTDIHYVPRFNITNKKLIPRGVNKYLSLYANGNSDKLKLMLHTYNSVDGIRKV